MKLALFFQFSRFFSGLRRAARLAHCLGWLASLTVLTASWTTPVAWSAQFPAQQPVADKQGAEMNELSELERQFVLAALQENAAEIQLGALLINKSNNPHVRNVARQLVTDHTQANTQLKALAQRLGVAIPAEPTSTDKAVYNLHNQLSGASLDQAFLKSQAYEHGASALLYQGVAKTAKNPDIKAYAAKYAPILQTHQHTLMQIPAAVGK
jgi:putative membrane protein